MKKKYDVVALGELLIDFTENGFSEQGNPILEVNPGGDVYKRQICDRVTIMRDGCVVKNSNINDISIDEIVSTMVGRCLLYTSLQ